jgi:polyisoprenoid-binding protein YceI
MKSLKTLSILLAGAVALASCEQAPKSDDAKTTDAKAVDTTKKSDAADLKVDVANSSISWVGTKVTGKHTGTFGVKEGSLSIKENQLVAGKFVIDVAALKVTDIPADNEMNGKLVGHLKSPDFFDTEKFPTATFEITGVETYKADPNAKVEEKDKEYVLENPTHTITGNLELRGEKKSITFPAVVNIANGKVEAEAKFNINRQDWKIAYEGKKDDLISNTVHIGLKISTVAAQ